MFVLLVYPASAQSDLRTESVFLITLDGLRWQELFGGIDHELMSDEQYVNDVDGLRKQYASDNPQLQRRTLMPFFWEVIGEEGQLYGNHTIGCAVKVTNNQWFSYPGYNEILSGKADPGITSNDKVPNPNETVLEFVNQQPAFTGRVAAFGSWDVFPYIVNEARSKVPVNAGFESATGANLSQKERWLNELLAEIPSPWATVRLDAFTHHYAFEYIKKNKPHLVYIAYGETDDFAHNGNYEAYIKSTTRTDAFISRLWQYAQIEPFYKGKTTFVITTDHGRGTMPLDTWRSHGTDIEGADEIWIAVLGPDTPALGEIENCELYQDQVASTVAKFLGLDFTAGRDVGKVIDAAFN